MTFRGIPAGYEDCFSDDDNSWDFVVCRKTNQLKITVVPDITTGACIDGRDFNAQLSANESLWFEEFKEMYNTYKQKPTAKQQIKSVLKKDSQPLKLGLKLFASCPDCNYLKKKNLALFIMESVCELYNNVDIATNCDDNTRMVAFNFIKSCGIISLQKSVIKTYDLHKIINLLIPKLHELINQGHYKDAANWSILLSLTHIFGLFDLVFPLILQDRISLAEDFLIKAKEQQLATVQFLDSLLDKKKTVYEHCDEIIRKYKYIDIKHDLLIHRPMSKLVTRFAKKFSIDIRYTPNLQYSKSSSYLHYLFHKYEDGGMSLDSWRELARDEANKSKALQLDLIANVTQYGNMEEAIYWIQLYNIPLEQCPMVVQLKMEQHTPECSDDNTCVLYTCNKQEVNKDEVASAISDVEYLTLPLAMDLVMWVDNEQKFLDMLSYFASHTVVSFDSEWKPCVNSTYVVALLQMATMERVYLVDCLSAELDANLWSLMGSKIFNNLEILKVGFSLNQDINMLHKSIPSLQLNLQLPCYLDLRELWHRLRHKATIKFPFESYTIKGEGLNALAELCLGKKLNKSNQCSNWTKRPLRHDQIVYAALDAYCLIAIYQVIGELLLPLGFDIDAVVEDITASKTGSLCRKQVLAHCSESSKTNETNKNGEKKDSNRLENISPVGASSTTKFMCDFMLRGLTKELRKLGLDCFQMFPSRDLNSYSELAKREDYTVLSRGLHYHVFCRTLSQTQCLQIEPDATENQVIKLLQHLNIQISEKDLHSRCVKCNYQEFIVATSSQVLCMLYGKIDAICDEFVEFNCDTKSINKRSWILFCITERIMKSKKTFCGKSIQLNAMDPQIIKAVKYVYICNNCGICTWDGEHSIDSNIMAYISRSIMYKDGKNRDSLLRK